MNEEPCVACHQCQLRVSRMIVAITNTFSFAPTSEPTAPIVAATTAARLRQGQGESAGAKAYCQYDAKVNALVNYSIEVNTMGK